MKRILSLILALLCFSVCFGQTIERSVISNFSFVSGDDRSINSSSYTFENNNTNMLVISGFQQPSNRQLVSQINLVKGSFEVYPNPSNDRIKLLGLDSKFVRYEIYSIEGQLALSNRWNGSYISLETLNQGTYFILIIDDQTSDVSTRKLVKL